MANLKKIGAAVAAVAICAVSLTGCTDTRYIVSYDNDKKVNSGIYLYNMLNQMQQQMYIMSYTQSSGSSEKIDYFSQKVEGKDFATYISEKTNESIKEYAAVVAQCDKLGVKLTSEEKKQISDSVSDAWTSAGDMFEEMGISKDSIKKAEQESQLRQKLFDYYYAEGGKEEVKSEDMVKYLNDNYVRYKTISIAKSTEEDKDKKKKADAESEKLIEKYLKQAQKSDFAGFDAVIDAYNEETTKKEEESSKAENSDAETESSASESTADSSSKSEENSSAAGDDTSSAAETSSSAASSEGSDSSDKESSKAASSGAKLQAVESSSAAESSASSTSTEDNSLVTFDPESVSSASADASSSGAEGEQQDPYSNETMYNFGKMDDDAKKSSTGKLVEHIKEMKAGKAEKYEDDDTYYIVIKGEVSERAEKYAEENKDTILEEMKGEEFEKKISQWLKDYSVKENTASFKRYTPKSVYDRWNDYLEKNSQAEG